MDTTPEPPAPACPLLSLGETSRQLRVRLTWLLAEAEANRIPGVKIDRTWYFNPAAVREALFVRAHGGIVPLDNLPDTARYLGMSPRALGELAAGGTIPAYRLGDRWAFQKETVCWVLMRRAGLGRDFSWEPPASTPKPVVREAPAQPGAAPNE